MRRFGVLFTLVLAAGLLLMPRSASAQVSIGAYGLRASDALGTLTDGGGAQGLGVRAAVSFPVLPVSAYAAGERLFPDCPEDGCSVWAGEVGVNVAVIPLPIVQPYVSGAITRRRFDSGIDGAVSSVRTEEGISAGLGVAVGLAGIGAFVEGRYEFLDDPYDQWIFRLGIMF